MTFWHALLESCAEDITTRERWFDEKRDEAQRLHRTAYQDWTRSGAEPKPRYGTN
jgi:hypothetical protein